MVVDKINSKIASDIYHHFMLGLFLLAAFVMGAVTGASYVYYDTKNFRPTYLQAFKGK